MNNFQNSIDKLIKMAEESREGLQKSIQVIENLNNHYLQLAKQMHDNSPLRDLEQTEELKLRNLEMMQLFNYYILDLRTRTELMRQVKVSDET